MTGRRLTRWLCAGLLCSGSLLIAHSGYIRSKALLAERLIAAAFEQHWADGKRHRPWSWADIAPVARLRVARLDLTRYVLDNSSGTAMAFGLGFLPDERVIAGHRDSWASFLADIRIGDSVRVERRGAGAEYRVCELRVVVSSAPPQLGPRELALATCYPIEGVTRTDQRLVARLCPAGRVME